MYEWLASLIPGGTAFILAVQRWSSPFLDQLFLTATYLGVEYFLVFLVAFLFWCVDRRLGLYLAYLVLLSAYVNSVFKNLLRLPRPDGEVVRVLRPEVSPGFPSGHAQGAITVWGYLALQVRRPIAWLMALTLIALISFSRIYLGVHFPHDVIGGLLIGGVILALYHKLAPAVAERLARLPLPGQIALALIIPLALWLAHPAEQQTRPEGVVLLYPAAAAARDMGFLVGISLGLLAERRSVRFQTQGSWEKRLLRLLPGALIVLLFWQGPKVLIPSDLPAVWDSGLRFVRYLLAGLAAAWWAPWAFVRLGLAAREAEKAQR